MKEGTGDAVSCCRSMVHHYCVGDGGLSNENQLFQGQCI